MAIKKLTFDDITSRVATYKYFYDDTLTICVLTLVNGFKSIGYSRCLNPADYVLKTGEDAAMEHAINKIYELESYRQVSEHHNAGG